MKWYFLICFIAGVIIAIFLVAMIVFFVASHRANLRNQLLLILWLVAVLYATREMFKSYREED